MNLPTSVAKRIKDDPPRHARRRRPISSEDLDSLKQVDSPTSEFWESNPGVLAYAPREFTLPRRSEEGGTNEPCVPNLDY